jgi:hypothetical protein
MPQPRNSFRLVLTLVRATASGSGSHGVQRALLEYKRAWTCATVRRRAPRRSPPRRVISCSSDAAIRGGLATDRRIPVGQLPRLGSQGFVCRKPGSAPKVASSLGAHSLLYGLRRDHAFRVQALVSFRHWREPAGPRKRTSEPLRAGFADANKGPGADQPYAIYDEGRGPKANSHPRGCFSPSPHQRCLGQKNFDSFAHGFMCDGRVPLLVARRAYDDFDNGQL